MGTVTQGMRVLALGLGSAVLLASTVACSLSKSDRDLDPIERAQKITQYYESGDTTLKQYQAQNQDLRRPDNADYAIQILEGARADFQRAVDLDVAGGGRPSAKPRQGLAKAQYLLATIQRVKLDAVTTEIAQLEERGQAAPSSLLEERDREYAQTLEYTDDAIRTLEYYERVLNRAAPFPSVSLLLADCYEIKNEWELAADALERFLTSTQVGPQTRQLQQRRIRAMRQKAFEEIDEGR